MHELSIAMSIVAAAADESQRRGTGPVGAVHIRLGALSGVVEDALRFSYGLAAADTALEGSTLVIERVPVLVQCAVCGTERPVKSIQHICCAVCGTPSPAITQGRELIVTALEIKE